MLNSIRDIAIGTTISVLAINVSSAQLVPDDIIIREIRPGAIELLSPGQSRQSSQPAAALKTDPELEAILEKAERFRKEGQFGVAAKLWQSVLERSGDALHTTDGKIFVSLSERVEAILAALPQDEGLASYRVTADALAKAILAEASDPFDQDALRKVVRKYFLSTIGDDAAFTLSSIYMDQFDFVGAIRMLEKIVRNYPDPSVSLVDVHTRIALCQAMMGEESNARKAIELAKNVAGDIPNRNLVSVESAIPDLLTQQKGRQRIAGMRMPLANRSRSGLMPALSDHYLRGDLQAVWQYYFLPKTLQWPDLKAISPLLGNDIFALAEESVTPEEERMILQWRKNRWRPSGLLLFDDEKVYFKTSLDLTVWKRDASDNDVLWRPLWRNKYKMDSLTQWLIQSQNRGRSSSVANSSRDTPSKTYEVQLFADRVFSQMALQAGVLYTIEGSRFDNSFVSYEPKIRGGYGVSYRRSRSNQLTAYDAETGKLLWTLPQIKIEDEFEKEKKVEPLAVIEDESEEGPWLTNGGFMAAPIKFGDLLIVPVNQSGAISIYALDSRQNGKTVWKAFLCDEPETGAEPNSPINLSIDGSDLFASCGLGVVFILDPTTGLIRFAKPYDRSGITQNSQSNQWNRMRGFQLNRMKFNHWLTDTIIPFGRQMVCFSSDAKHIEALDRNSGQMIWRGNARPLEAKVDYVIGVYDDILYAGGNETILAYNLAEEGRMIWGGNKMFSGEISYGRGMVTRNGVFVPVGDQIHLYSLGGDNGKPELLRTMSVRLGTGAPVGNLYSDGDKIWVHGANRVYALEPMK